LLKQPIHIPEISNGKGVLRYSKPLEGIPDLGNSVQNARIHQINASLDMPNLYKYLGLTPREGDPGNSSAKKCRCPNPGSWTTTKTRK
jgi:hypothetical protein